MSSSLRSQFAAAHGDVVLLDAGGGPVLDRYLVDRRLAGGIEMPARVARAGEGNMNLTLRVTLLGRTLILKQGRPWVEKYDHIAAPWERTLVEGQFYEAVRKAPAVADHMPVLLDVDAHNHVLALEDVGTAGDLTSMYADRQIPAATVGELLAWLSALSGVAVAESSRAVLANRAMRALNHEHIFSLPLAHRNGIDLDGITRGLDLAASGLKDDRAYAARVSDLGAAYLADGAALVHGDYFPGSWVRSPGGIRIIDPEFCFLGAREFDYGVMLAHLALARVDVEAAAQVVAASVRARLDGTLMLGFAGVEIMRRLLGVAQLPLPYGLDVKRHLLELSLSLVLTPERGLTPCW